MQPTIFDPENRKEPRNWDNMELVYDSPNNNTLMFLNELPGRYGKFLRDMSHRWLWDMPDDGIAIAERINPDGVGRIYEGMKNDWEFRLCWWQMFTNQIFFPKASRSELLDIGVDCLEAVKYHIEGSNPIIVACSFVHEHEEQLAIEKKEWKYKNLLNDIFSGTGMTAMLWMEHQDIPPPEWAVREAAEYCLGSPLGGKVNIFYDGNQSLVTDQEFHIHQSSSTLHVGPSKTGESVVDVSVLRTYSGDSEHLSQVEEALRKVDWQQIGDDAFILCVSTNLMRQIFDVPAVYRLLYDGIDPIFAPGKWDRVSGVIIGSPLPWHLPDNFAHDVPFSVFLNPNADKKIPEILLTEMPYIVDTVDTKIHHGQNGYPKPAMDIEKYLIGEDFDTWNRLRSENNKERNSRMHPPPSEEITEAFNKALSKHSPISEEGIKWLGEIGILEICANASERLPWGGAARVKISSPSDSIIDVKFLDERSEVLMSLDIRHKHCSVSVSMISVNHTMTTQSYDMSLRSTLWEAITYIHKILNPESENRSYLKWSSHAYPLSDETTKVINTILSLHINSKEIGTPQIKAIEDSLVVDWVTPQHKIHLTAYLKDNAKISWLDSATNIDKEFHVDDIAGWKHLMSYLKKIM